MKKRGRVRDSTDQHNSKDWKLLGGRISHNVSGEHVQWKKSVTVLTFAILRKRRMRIKNNRNRASQKQETEMNRTGGRWCENNIHHKYTYKDCVLDKHGGYINA